MKNYAHFVIHLRPKSDCPALPSIHIWMPASCTISAVWLKALEKLEEVHTTFGFDTQTYLIGSVVLVNFTDKPQLER